MTTTAATAAPRFDGPALRVIEDELIAAGHEDTRTLPLAVFRAALARIQAAGLASTDIEFICNAIASARALHALCGGYGAWEYDADVACLAMLRHLDAVRFA